jgi:hypothetical protein
MPSFVAEDLKIEQYLRGLGPPFAQKSLLKIKQLAELFKVANLLSPLSAN